MHLDSRPPETVRDDERCLKLSVGDAAYAAVKERGRSALHPQHTPRLVAITPQLADAGSGGPPSRFSPCRFGNYLLR